MFDFLTKLLDPSDFMPRAWCGTWSDGHVLLHNFADGLIGVAYLAIPCVLMAFAAQRPEVPFRGLLWLFGAFIIACGLTHFMEVVMFYYPVYRLAGVLKLMTALVSLATVAALVPVIPRALAMRTPAELQREIDRRIEAEAALHAANTDLEQRIRERTEELQERQRREKEIIEQELSKAREELVRQTRLAALGQVAASVAHDLRNPLGAVRNAAYFLRRKIPPDQPAALDQLRLIDRETASCDRIIDNLLEMSRGREPIREQFDLGQLVRESIERAGPPTNVTWTVTMEPEPLLVKADPVQLQRVFDNLTRNALEAFEHGGQILVAGRLFESYTELDFSDDGPGIPLDARARLFEPLVTTKARGTGLGLFVCRQMIEKHGGTLILLDTPQGTAFRIRLPKLVGDVGS